MKRTEAESVGDVLRAMVQENYMHNKLYELKAAELWVQMMGEHMAARCGRPTVRNGTMYISVASPALRQELTMSRSAMIRAINKKLGKEVIKEIRFN